MVYSIKGKRRRWVVYWTVIYDCLPLVKTIKMPHWILKWQGIFITTHKFIFRETFLDMPFDTSIPMFGPLLSHVSLMCENLEKTRSFHTAWKTSEKLNAIFMLFFIFKHSPKSSWCSWRHLNWTMDIYWPKMIHDWDKIIEN